ALLIVACFASSCSDEKDVATSSGVALDNGIVIYLQNAEGENLFETPNYMSEDFKTYYVVNGVPVENNQGHLDNPRHFNMHIDPPSMMMFLNMDRQESLPQTIIKWNETESDTLTAQYESSMVPHGSDYKCMKVWLNGDLVWDGTPD